YPRDGAGGGPAVSRLRGRLPAGGPGGARRFGAGRRLRHSRRAGARVLGGRDRRGGRRRRGAARAVARCGGAGRALQRARRPSGQRRAGGVRWRQPGAARARRPPHNAAPDSPIARAGVRGPGLHGGDEACARRATDDAAARGRGAGGRQERRAGPRAGTCRPAAPRRGAGRRTARAVPPRARAGIRRGDERGAAGGRVRRDALRLGAYGRRRGYLRRRARRGRRDGPRLGRPRHRLRDVTPRTIDYLVARGERLSAQLFAAALEAEDCPAAYVDATEVVQTDGTFGNASVELGGTVRTARRALGPVLARGTVPVVPGF